METLTNPFLEKQLDENESEFIKLRGTKFAEYQIIYHVKDDYSIKDIVKFKDKQQLIFQKYESKILQLNLAYVDSIFPTILADLAIDVFLKKVTCFSEYIKAEKSSLFIDEDYDKIYLQNKISTFMHLLAYSDISKNKASQAKDYSDRIYYLRNESGDIEFYSIYNQQMLLDFLIKRTVLEIDMTRSSIFDNKVMLCLVIQVA